MCAADERFADGPQRFKRDCVVNAPSELLRMQGGWHEIGDADGARASGVFVCACGFTVHKLCMGWAQYLGVEET
jgi:hypothetical protein